MPVRFAAARSAAHSPVARALARQQPGPAANDQPGAPLGPRLETALRHFAAHGLGAVPAALSAARASEAAGDETAHANWQAIAALFDRRIIKAPGEN